MEPLNPKLRTALKEAHPGLTDEDIDAYEALLAQRMQCDPNKEPERIARLDRERIELMERKMPRYAAVAQAFRAVSGRGTPPTQKVTVTLKTPKT